MTPNNLTTYRYFKCILFHKYIVKNFISLFLEKVIKKVGSGEGRERIKQAPPEHGAPLRA